MFKIKKSKIAALALAFIMIFTVILPCTAHAAAVNIPTISVTADNLTPKTNDVITVTVSIPNLSTITPKVYIPAMLISVTFNTECFEFEANSATNLRQSSNSEIVSLSYDGDGTVSYAFAANGYGYTLPQGASRLFSFRLRVKNIFIDSIAADFGNANTTIYNYPNQDPTVYELAEYTFESVRVNVMSTNAGIFLNGTDENGGTYDVPVTVSFGGAGATLYYENREAVKLTAPYVCDRNGTYRVTAESNGKIVEKEFEIKRKINNYSVNLGSYREFPLGQLPDLSRWSINIYYADGSYITVLMSDPDVTVEGYTDYTTIPGTKTLSFKYRGVDTGITERVTVQGRKPAYFTIINNPIKAEYLEKEKIDVTGGVIKVTFDNGETEDVEMKNDMLSEYYNYLTGMDQTILITYLGYTNENEAVTVRFIARDDVDALISKIDALDVDSLTLADKPAVDALLSKYNALSETEKNGVTNYDKLLEASSKFVPEDQTTGDEETTQQVPEVDDNGNSKKIIWIIVIIIIVLSLLGGLGYFLLVYFKKKRDLEKEDEYFDDNTPEFEGTSDGDLSYEGDVSEMQTEDLQLSDDIEDVSGDTNLYDKVTPEHKDGEAGFDQDEEFNTESAEMLASDDDMKINDTGDKKDE